MNDRLTQDDKKRSVIHTIMHNVPYEMGVISEHKLCTVGLSMSHIGHGQATRHALSKALAEFALHA